MKLGTIELEGKFVIAYDTLLDGWDCLKEILDEVRKDADAASFGIPTKSRPEFKWRLRTSRYTTAL